MSRFSGPQGRGAMRTFRETARAEAGIRQEAERGRELARATERSSALRDWLRTPQGRASLRFRRDLERRLGVALARTQT